MLRHSPFERTKQVTFELKGLSVMLAMPCIGSMVPAETAKSLMATVEILQQKGVNWTIQFLCGCSIVEKARSLLVDHFLRSTHNRIFWLDADMIWEASDFLRILGLSTKMEIVGGVYPAKMEPITYMVRAHDMTGIPRNKWGCLEMRGFGMGFTCVSREVIEKLAAKAPKVKVLNYPEPVAHLFRQEVRDNDCIGEDMAFFDDCIKAGYAVHLDPSVSPGHFGCKVYRGDFAAQIKKVGAADGQAKNIAVALA